MDISQLDEFFSITQYRLCDYAADVQLVGGNILVTAKYTFHNEAGVQTGRIKTINMVVTQQQSDELKAILQDILQASNAAIEAETCWTPL